MRMPDAEKARNRSRRGLANRRLRGNHAIEQRDPDRHACSFQKRPARNELLGKEHIASLIALLLHSRLEWTALDDSHQDRQEPVMISIGIAHNRAYHRHILVLHPTT